MTSIKKLKEVFETDFFSQTLFTQYILKSMIKNKAGSILYISSSSALDGNEGRSAYSSAKAAIIAQAKVLSREVGIYNIRVNTIAPGLTDTDMMKKNTPKELVDEVISRISLKRIAYPEEIAKVASFIVFGPIKLYYRSGYKSGWRNVMAISKLEQIKNIKNFALQVRKNILEMAVSAGIDGVHFGGALSITEIVSTLFAYQMKIDKKNPNWEERDRFILSKGHACLAYYAALCEVGYISREELKTFEKNDTNLLGHPVINRNLGIDFSNGSLGMGFHLE